MSDRIGEMIRRNRLLALRDCLWEGVPVKYPDDFKSVFTWLDFEMVNSMHDDYLRSLEYKPRVADVAPASVKWFIRENRSVGDALSVNHAEWNRIRTKPMSRAIRDAAVARWRDDRRQLLDRVRGIRQWLRNATADELRHIARPDPARTDNKFMDGDIPPTERPKRWSWYYWYETDLGRFHNNLSCSMALAFLLIWQVESQLGVPRLVPSVPNFDPVFRVR